MARLRKTKVIATIGPACDDEDILRKMIQAGMNVARLNISHGNHDEHRERIRRIRSAEAAENANVAIMLDTKGVEIRTGKLKDGVAELTTGDFFTLYTDERIGTREGVSISYEGLPDDVSPGSKILLDDGKIQLNVISVNRTDSSIATEISAGGTLGNTKGVNVPDATIGLSAVSDENRDDLEFAVAEDLDYIAASFMRNIDDVRAVRAVINEAGGDIPIIAKIENQEGVRNLVELVAEADGTMVARGDLGVEIPLAEVPATQKKIIRTTVTNGKPVITATQMLDSMERSPTPTRAEVTDVANAILDGTSAVMLSGETAAGDFPVQSVATMARLALEAELHLAEYGHLQKILPESSAMVTEAVANAAITMAHHLNAAAIMTLTEGGFTARTLSKFRPDTPILAVTRSPKVMRKLAMNWGVTAIFVKHDDTVSDDHVLDRAVSEALDRGYVNEGDMIVATTGVAHQPGSTNKIKIITAS